MFTMYDYIKPLTSDSQTAVLNVFLIVQGRKCLLNTGLLPFIT